MEQLWWCRPQRLLASRHSLLIVLSSSAALLYVVWPLLAAYIQQGGSRYSGRSRRRRHQAPPGLVNYGNSCYANCLLQALASCDAFCDDLAARVTAWRAAATTDIAPLASRLSRLLAGLRGGHSSYGVGSVSPSLIDVEVDEVDALQLLTALRDRDWDPAASQQDAHELLSVLLQAINEELLAASRGRGPTLAAVAETAEVSGDVEADCPAHPMFRSVSVRAAPVERTWVRCGLAQTRVKCLSCGWRPPARLEVLHSLSLSLPEDDVSLGSVPMPLQLLLRRAFRVEWVRDARCDRCCGPPMSVDSSGVSSTARTVTLSRTTRLARAPASLVLHLQRVSWSARYGCPVKSTAPVSFPNLLDIRPLMPTAASASAPASPTAEDVPPPAHACPSKLYRLVAVIVHLGDETSGHYVTYRWDGISRRWWRISDDSVAPVAEETVLGLTDVYMLFYELLAA